MAILANYLVEKRAGETLDDYLENRVFAGQEGVTLAPNAEDEKGFEQFIQRYKKGLPAVRAAVDGLD